MLEVIIAGTVDISSIVSIVLELTYSLPINESGTHG
jgi:hypothetical protein